MRTLLLATLLLAPAAHAQNSQVKKARAGLEAWESGDAEGLDDAVVAIDRAVAHKKTGTLPEVWELNGRIRTELALKGGAPSPAGVREATATWTEGRSHGVAAEPAQDALVKLLTATQIPVRDDLESKRFEKAWRRIEAAMETRSVLAEEGWANGRVEEPLLRFGILTAVRTDHIDEATRWFGDWLEVAAFEPSVAVQVASAIADAKGAEAAAAFVDPLLEDRPLDSALLTRLVRILIDAEQLDAARARIETASEAQGARSSASQLLLARLHTAVGNPEAARTSWEAALEQNPDASDAWVPLARLLMDEVRAAQATLDAGGLPWKEKKALREQREADLERAVALVGQAHKAAGPKPDRALLELMVSVYGAAEMDDEKARAEKALQSAQE